MSRTATHWLLALILALGLAAAGCELDDAAEPDPAEEGAAEPAPEAAEDPDVEDPEAAPGEEPEEEVLGAEDLEGEPVRIGAVIDITGAGASLAAPQRNVFEMVVEQVNETGGVDGRPLEMIVLDNQSTEDQAALQANRLVFEDEVDVILGASRTGTSLAMRQIAEDNEVPMISLAAGFAIIDGSDWVFKTAQNDSVVLEVLATYYEEMGYGTVGLLRDASGFGEGVGEILTETGAEHGVEMVIEERFDPEATDFTAQLVNIRGEEPDVNLIWGIPPAAALATVQYSELDLDAPLTHSHGVANEVFLETAGDHAEGVVFPLGKLLTADELPDDDPQKEVIQDFVADYQEQFGSEPSTFAGHAWDAVMLAIDAVETVGTDPHDLRDHLEQVDGFVGISGVFNMSPEDHAGIGAESLVMIEVADGDWVLHDVQPTQEDL